MHSSARYTHGERENRWFHRRRKSNENLNDKIACFSVPRVRIGLKWSPAPSENCLKWIRKQQNFIQKPYRVHSSAVRTSWETILCAFESWDRAWQHTNTLRTRLRSIRLQIYGFAPWHDNNHTARSQTEPPTDLKNCTRGVGTILGKCPPSMPRIFFSSVVLETIFKVLDTRFQGAKNENSQNAAGSTRVTGYRSCTPEP